MKRIMLIAAAVLLAVPAIEASEHSVYDVTPENIDEMPLDFEITCKTTNRTLVAFSMVVSSGESTLSTRTNCQLEVFDDSTRIVSCKVESVRASGVLRCDFIVGKELSPSAYLHFANMTGHSTEEYRFRVSDWK